jgi:tetratricopeptide (TPR) repeat protein
MDRYKINLYIIIGVLILEMCRMLFFRKNQPLIKYHYYYLIGLFCAIVGLALNFIPMDEIKASDFKTVAYPVTAVVFLFFFFLSGNFKKKDSKTIMYCKEILRKNPSDIKTLHLISAAYFRKNDFNNAILYANKYLELDSGNEMMYFFIGYSYFYIDDFGSALQSFNNGISLVENEPRNYLGVAHVYEKLGDLDKSKKYLQRAIDLYTEQGKTQDVERVQHYLNNLIDE